jgi:hypothetical protein
LATVKLDGTPVEGKTPFQLRNLAAGPHVLEVSLPGYQTVTKEVVARHGESFRVDIPMPAAEVMANFTSEPPGAQVTLVVDGKRQALGDSPRKVPVDPSKKYEVVFEKDGYVTVTRPLDPSKELALASAAGRGEITIAVVLDRAQIAVAPKDPPPPRDPPKDVIKKDPPKDVVKKDPPKDSPPPKDPPKDPPKEPAVAGTGTLMIGAKPQCKIYVDGKDTGLVTPQRALEVKSGTRRITLVNNDFNIKETFSVEVKPGETAKVIKDYSDKIE